jgi:hypothetical protein
MHVVMLDVDAQHLFQVPTSDDQQPVQALGTDRADPRLRERVRIGRLDRGQDHLSAFGAEHVVERAAELGIPIAQQELDAAPLLAEHQQQVPRLLGDPAPLGLVVTPARWTRRVSSSMKNNTYSRRNHTVSTVKQVAGEDPGGLLAQEPPPCRWRPPWRGVQAVAAQSFADRGRRDLHAEVEQFALDPLVAPAGILGGKPDD